MDSFQGEENEFVFIDLVVGHHHGPQKSKDVAEDSDEDDQDESFNKGAGGVSAHVKSANRLCCAPTRGRSCVVVFGQMTALLGTAKDKQKRASAAISEMARDLYARKLVYHDEETLDTNPIGETTRAKWDQARLADELKARWTASFNAIRVGVDTAGKAVFDEDFKGHNPTVYSTATRRTVRPNMTGNVAQDAETHDPRHGPIRRSITTATGAAPLLTAGQTQRSAKKAKKGWGEEKGRGGAGGREWERGGQGEGWRGKEQGGRQGEDRERLKGKSKSKGNEAQVDAGERGILKNG